MVHKKILSFLCTSALIINLSVFNIYARNYDISDLPATSKWYPTVQSILDQGYMSLININDKSLFKPSTVVSRKEFAMILANINGDKSILKNPNKNTYADVRKDNMYYRYIETERQFIPDFGDKFKPDSYITKEDAAYAIVKAMGYDSEKAISDGVQPEVDLSNVIEDSNTISHDLLKYVSIAINNRLIYADEGKNDTFYFNGKRGLTRLQLAILLDKAYQMGDYTKKAPSTQIPKVEPKVIPAPTVKPQTSKQTSLQPQKQQNKPGSNISAAGKTDNKKASVISNNSNDNIINSSLLEIGNTNGNITNFANVAQNGNWIYYSNTSDKLKLYKIRTDGTQNAKLTDDYNDGWINVIGNWIYYASDMNKGNIYKIKTDGTQKTRLNDDNDSCWINVVGDWIYYSSDLWNGKLYKINIDGSQKTMLTDDKNQCINVVGNWIYYINNSSNQNIYKIRTDGSQKTSLSNDFSDNLNVYGDWIYYQNGSDKNKIYKIKTDGTSKTKLGDDQAAYINIADGWIYYGNKSDGGKMYKIRTDGTQKTKLNEDNDSCWLNIVGDWIYYKNGSYGYYLYKIKTNGTERALVP